MIIGFSTTKKFKIFSWLIKLVENTSYSHVYIRFYSSKFDRWLVYHASGTMVHFIEWERFKDKSKIIEEFTVDCDEETRVNIIKDAIDLAAAPYGVKQVLGIILVKLARLFKRDINNPFSDGNATWICSEILYSLLKKDIVSLKVHPDNVTPKDLYEYFDSKFN